MNRNLIITAHPDGQMSLNSGGLTFESLDDIRLALVMVQQAQNSLQQQLVELQVQQRLAEQDDEDG